MKRAKQVLQAFVWAFVVQLVCNGCHNFYKVTQTGTAGLTEKSKVIDSLRLNNRDFILRSGSQAFYMKNVSISSDKKSLTCVLDSLDFDHLLHLKMGYKGKMRYRKTELAEAGVVNEVHFYIPPDNTAVRGNYTLQLEKIQKIEVLEKDKARTTSSYLIGAVGYTLGAFLVAAIIIAATKSSCPFVSGYDGNDFSLQGEIYGGAIYPQLARNDYMPLKLGPMADGSLQVKISNELQEHQYTDMADLWVITHDKNQKVLADEKGNLFTISDPHTPTNALLNNHRDVTASLISASDNRLLYMDDTTGNASNQVIMEFNKPVSARKATLMLGLKNSYFLDLLYGELAKGFGKYYNTYIKKQGKKSVESLTGWTKEQQIPLEVSIKTSSGWKKLADITTVGPLATRNIAVPIELSESNEPVLAVKLSSGFMFWEIDYAAIDYSPGNAFTIQKIQPTAATDELGNNIMPAIAKEDASYLAQPSIGNVATMVYNVDPLNDPSKSQTFILHTKGYYEHVRDFKTKPDLGFLKQFKNPGAFPLFGMNLYKKMTAENMGKIVTSN